MLFPMLAFFAAQSAPPPTTMAPAPTVTSPSTPAAVANETADGRRRVLVLDLKSNGVDKDVVQTLSDLVAAAVTREPSLAVTSGSDIRNKLEVEGDRQAAGCDEIKDACLAELAGALGADIIVSGSVGRLGPLLVISLSLYDAGQQAAVGREKAEAVNLAELSPLVDQAVGRLFGHETVKPLSTLVPAGAVVAGAGAVVAVIGFSIAGWSLGVQTDSKSSGADKGNAENLLTPGVIVGSVGAVGLVAGGALLALGLVGE